MSVRRLADDVIQPEGFKFDRRRSAEAKVWIKKYPRDRQQSAVIPLLMLAQEQEGWVTKASIEHVADMLDMPLIRVMEVATFYTQFQLQPVGTRAHVQVCGTTPCMLRGAEDLIKVCQRRINDRQFHRNADGTLSWEEVECQGACVNAPMVMIGRDAYEDLTPERLEEIIDAFEAGRGDEIAPGPQIDRVFAAPVTGLTSLLDGEGTAGAPGATPLADDGNRPAAVARPASPDDLKLISGVGPKLEEKLHGLGVYTFAQVAGWSRAERQWVDDHLKFRGRIERDDWAGQAKALAKGGVDEYIRVFGRKPK